jgi:Permuted papain-like amidase enzyme, YaeF/YiiX, C92 family
MYRYLLFTLIALPFLLQSCNAPEAAPLPKKYMTMEEEIAKEKELSQKNWQLVQEAKKLVQNGDLLLRQGTDYTSEIIKNYSQKEKFYSHCGIAVLENGQMNVYHIIAGDENPSEKMMKQPIDSFCNPLKKTAFGIFRYKLTPEQMSSFLAMMESYYQKGVKFDRKFDLATEDKMYCAEVVSKCLARSTANMVQIPTSVWKDFRYIAIDNMYLNPWCSEVNRYNFEQIQY